MRRLVLLGVLLGAAALLADDVYFKDGRPPLLGVDTEERGGQLIVDLGMIKQKFPMSEIEKVVRADDGGSENSGSAESGGEVHWIRLADGRTFRGRILNLGKRVRVRTDKADFWVPQRQVDKIWKGAADDVEADDIETTFGGNEQVAILFEKKFSVTAPDGWLIDSNPARPLVDAIVSDPDRKAVIEFSVIEGDPELYREPNDVNGDLVEDTIDRRLEDELDRVSRKAKVEVVALPGLGVPAYRAAYSGRFRFDTQDWIFSEYRFVSSGNIYSIRSRVPKGEEEDWAEPIREAVSNFSTLGPISLAGTVYTDGALGLTLDALDPEWVLSIGLVDNGLLFRVLFEEPTHYFELRDLSGDLNLDEAVTFVLEQFEEKARRFEKVGAPEEIKFGEKTGKLFRYKGISGRRPEMHYATMVFHDKDGRLLAATGNYLPPRADKSEDQIAVETMLASIRPLGEMNLGEEIQKETEALELLFRAEKAHEDDKDYSDAIDFAEQALAIFPRYARAMRVKAKALDESGGDSDDVQDLYLRAAQLDPDPNLDAILAQLWQDDGNRRIEEGRWRSGLRLLEKAYAANPSERSLQKDLHKAYEGYAEFMIDEEDGDIRGNRDAVNMLERAFRRFEDLPELKELLDAHYKKLAKAYEKEKNYDRAIGITKDRLDLWEGDEKKIRRIESDLKTLEKKKERADG